MTRTALITLSSQGAVLAEQVGKELPDSELFVHGLAGKITGAESFSRVIELTERLFRECTGLVYFAPCGVVVRAIAPLIRSKLEDPAVVVVDVGGRFAVSLLSGHEGGANDLAVRVANIIGAEPVISTATEALKTLIVGVGCKSETPSHALVSAVKSALASARLNLSDVRLIASADIKKHEKGLIEAAAELGVPFRIVSSEEIRSSHRDFAVSEFVESKVNLPAVAEPSALLAGRRTTLLVPKQVIDGITVAIARESCLWSE
jgi:cobalt-precorrin 5A hydrolase